MQLPDDLWSQLLDWLRGVVLWLLSLFA